MALRELMAMMRIGGNLAPSKYVKYSIPQGGLHLAEPLLALPDEVVVLFTVSPTNPLVTDGKHRIHQRRNRKAYLSHPRWGAGAIELQTTNGGIFAVQVGFLRRRKTAFQELGGATEAMLVPVFQNRSPGAEATDTGAADRRCEAIAPGALGPQASSRPPERAARQPLASPSQVLTPPRAANQAGAGAAPP